MKGNAMAIPGEGLGQRRAEPFRGTRNQDGSGHGRLLASRLIVGGLTCGFCLSFLDLNLGSCRRRGLMGVVAESSLQIEGQQAEKNF